MRAIYRAWKGALVCFVVAGLTGGLYRAGLAFGWTAGLDLANVRHAHSHLMYFGWVTPALFALIAARLQRHVRRPLPRGGGFVLAACFVAAALAYPLFLAFGYRPVELGAARLPLSVIASTLNMVGWYGFALWYRRATRGAERTRPLVLWDLALVFLVASTLGAFGLALLKPLGVADPMWASALTHLFLDLFSEGWLVLAVLGLAADVLHLRASRLADAGLYLLAAGLPVTFALGMPSVLVPAGLMTLAQVGALCVGAGLLLHVIVLLPRVRSWVWGVPLVLLGLKALAQLVAGTGLGPWYADQPGLRILYLHVMLLGFVSLGLPAAAAEVFGRRRVPALGAFYAAVLVLLASLVPLTPLWPVAWMGRWAFVAAACIAPLPVLAVLRMLGPPSRPGYKRSRYAAPSLVPA